MSLKLSWRGREGADVVALARARSYAPAMGEAGVYQQRLANDPRVSGDDLLLAERDGIAVGTATSYSMTMWVRGRAVPCQGVGWVGTIKTQRRSGGVASQIMAEVIRKGRERGQVLSALMPFRNSFYEHFGYGVVERRASWTIPLSVMPSGPADGFEFLEGADEARRNCRQRMVEAGQCDIERTAGMWTHWTAQEGEGYVAGDRAANGSMRSWFVWREVRENEQNVLVVDDMAFYSVEALRRGLCFFGTLRDQFRAVRMTLPADLQVNRLLKETHVPPGAKSHEAASAKWATRMQVRVLDHARLVDGMRVPEYLRGSVVVAIAETEGGISRLRIEMDAGGASVSETTAAAADVECADRHWAAIVLGDLPGTRAVEMGLIKVNRPAAVGLLDAFAVAGPAPFCNEHF